VSRSARRSRKPNEWSVVQRADSTNLHGPASRGVSSIILLGIRLCFGFPNGQSFGAARSADRLLSGCSLAVHRDEQVSSLNPMAKEHPKLEKVIGMHSADCDTSENPEVRIPCQEPELRYWPRPGWLETARSSPPLLARIPSRSASSFLQATRHASSSPSEASTQTVAGPRASLACGCNQ
jgi:hypothetical protein